MDVLLTVATAAVLTVLTGWYFFGPKKSRRAELEGGRQVVTVTVKGGYSPDLVEVVQGVPVRLVFDRQESGDCSSRVVLPDFRINEALPAYASTTVDFTPQQTGEFGFACGMNMLHGTVRVVAGDAAEPAAGGAAAPLRTGAEPEPAADPAGSGPQGGSGAGQSDDAEAAERAAAERREHDRVRDQRLRGSLRLVGRHAAEGA